jgi:outer membrane receptor protein involved in Fe transport
MMIFMAISMSSMSLLAQKQDTSAVSLIELSLEELMNIRITSASKFEQTVKESPSSTSVITRNQIKNYGWVSTNDVLSKLPGFALSQDYERQTISSRGVFESWNSNHLLMMVDGVPMNSIFGGSAVTNEVTPLLFTKSMEVIRGPGSALYGSNATNGMINFNSLSASDLDDKIELRFRRASWNTNIFDVVTGGKTSNFSFVSAFNFYESDGASYSSLDASNTQKYNINNSQANLYFFNKIEGAGKFAGFSFQHHEQSWKFATGHGWLNLVPDIPENMSDSRRTLTLAYRSPDQSKRVKQEYILKYSRRGQDYFQRFYRNGDAGYPFGLTEVVKSSFVDYFGRAQWKLDLGSNSNLLGGMEYTFFDYRGDDIHLSNVNLNTDYSATANNELTYVGSYLPYLEGNNYNSSGLYAQYNTPDLGGLIATLGLRYDRAWFKYNDLPTSNVEKKSLSKLNPRLTLVYKANDKLTLKAMGGSAFRSPSPFELFVGNSFNGASNLKELKPELVRTYELASDLTITNNLTWRMNGYMTESKNVIAYGASNVLINLFSSTSAGIENELWFSANKFQGFLNHSYTKRIDESAADESISLHKKKLTWYPGHLFNLGVKYNNNKFSSSAQLHYQGSIQRRDSDKSDAYNQLRGENVKAWTTVDLKAGYKITSALELSLQLNNLTDQKGYLFKTYKQPFDYQIPGRRIMLDMTFRF